MASALCLAGFFADGGFHRAGAHWLSMTKSEGNLLLARGFPDIEPGGLCPPAGGSRRSCLHRLESIRNPKLASLCLDGCNNPFLRTWGKGWRDRQWNASTWPCFSCLLFLTSSEAASQRLGNPRLGEITPADLSWAPRAALLASRRGHPRTIAGVVSACDVWPLPRRICHFVPLALLIFCWTRYKLLLRPHTHFSLNAIGGLVCF